MTVGSTAPLFSDASASQLDRLHAVATPADRTVQLGGVAQSTHDSVHAITSRLALVLGIIAGITLVLMFLLTGSVVLPVKAVLLNILSLTAAFGAMVWVFQEGHLGALGAPVTGTLEVNLPMLLFCIAFGLSMDYEVFLISRIREYWLESDRTPAANNESVALGVAHTGRVITAAALLMSISFGALMAAQVSNMRMFGLGITLAVLVDATLVRMLLVPAFMRVLGRVNWWAPRPLVRLHNRFGPGETVGPLGGGTSVQKKYGIEDSPDLLFRDLTDWSVVGPNGFPDYRYNDREIIRAFADNSAATFEWLVAHGVVFVDKAPDALGGNSVGNSVPREMHSAVMDWPMVHTGEPADPAVQKTRSSGNGLMRSLEVAAKKAGVEILLEHRMTRIYRSGSERRPRARHRGRQQGLQVEHPRAQGRHHRHRRLDRQCQLPADVRPAPDRRILRSRRHAVVRPGCQRRARGHGDWRILVGFLQPDRRIRLERDQAGLDRMPIQLPASPVDAGQSRIRARSRDGPQGGELAGPHPGQHAGQAVLRRDRTDNTSPITTIPSIPMSRAAGSMPRTSNGTPTIS